MCPPGSTSEPTLVPTTTGEIPSDFVAADSHAPSAPEVASRKIENGATASPYGAKYSDFLSNVSIIYISN